MQVRICDTVGCGNLVEHEAKDYCLMVPDMGNVKIQIPIDEVKALGSTALVIVDRCLECERRARTKLAFAAWNDLKRKKTRKVLDAQDRKSTTV